MRQLIVIGLIALSSLCFGQKTIVGKLHGAYLKVEFMNDFSLVRYTIGEGVGLWLKVYDMTEFPFDGSVCNYFYTLDASGRFTFTLCNDGSLALELPDGSMLEGTYNEIKDNPY